MSVPALVFRRTHEAIYEQQPNVRGDLEYLRILHLAAATMESEVEAALGCLLDDGVVPTADEVRDLVAVDDAPALPALEAYEVCLQDYDRHLEDEEVAS